jgi:hypothetical protein
MIENIYYAHLDNANLRPPWPEYWSPEFKSFVEACLVEEEERRPGASELLEVFSFMTSIHF